MDRRPPPGLGQRAGRVLPGAPDRRESHAPRRATSCSRSSSSSAENPAIQELLAATVERAASQDERLTALRAMARTRAKELPPVVDRAARARARRPRARGHAPARSRSRARRPPSKDAAAELHAALLRVARDSASPLDVRLDALAAIRGGLTSVDPGVFDLLRTGLEPAQPASIRGRGRGVIEKAKLDRKQLLHADGRARERRPAGAAAAACPPSISAQRRSAGARDDRGASSGRRADRACGRTSFVPRLAKYPESVQKQGEALLASLNVDAAKQTQRLEELLAGRSRTAISGAGRRSSTARRRRACRATRSGIWAARSAPT